MSETGVEFLAQFFKGPLDGMKVMMKEPGETYELTKLGDTDIQPFIYTQFYNYEGVRGYLAQGWRAEMLKSRFVVNDEFLMSARDVKHEVLDRYVEELDALGADPDTIHTIGWYEPDYCAYTYSVEGYAFLKQESDQLELASH